MRQLVRDERDELVLQAVELAQALVLGREVPLSSLGERARLLLGGEQPLAVGLGSLALGDVLSDRRDADDLPAESRIGEYVNATWTRLPSSSPAHRLELADPVLRRSPGAGRRAPPLGSPRA